MRGRKGRQGVRGKVGTGRKNQQREGGFKRRWRGVRKKVEEPRIRESEKAERRECRKSCGYRWMMEGG